MSERHYEAIKEARAILAGLPDSNISEKTAEGYKREYLRLAKAGTISAMVEAAKDTKVASTWYRRRAALVYSARNELRKILAEQDRMQRTLKGPNDPARQQWEKLVERSIPYARLLPKLQEVKKWPPISERKRRETKKRSLRGLPDDWREALAKRLPKYRTAFLVAAATGCRPAELVTGVSLSYDTNPRTGKVTIKATIQGAKVRESVGQPERSIFIELDDRPESLAGQLQKELVNGPIKVGLTGERLFSGAVRDAARREWPKRKMDMSAYSLRHQFAADMKGAGWKDEDIAKAMGHITTKTASYYGNKSQARGGVVLDGVEASRKVINKKLKIK